MATFMFIMYTLSRNIKPLYYDCKRWLKRVAEMNHIHGHLNFDKVDCIKEMYRMICYESKKWLCVESHIDHIHSHLHVYKVHCVKEYLTTVYYYCKWWHGYEYSHKLTISITASHCESKLYQGESNN